MVATGLRVVAARRFWAVLCVTRARDLAGGGTLLVVAVVAPIRERRLKMRFLPSLKRCVLGQRALSEGPCVEVAAMLYRRGG